MKYDVMIIGAGPGGIFSAYELMKLCPEKKIAVFEAGYPLENMMLLLYPQPLQILLLRLFMAYQILLLQMQSLKQVKEG